MVLVASWTNLPGIVECRPTNPSSGPFNSAADGRRFATGLRTDLWRGDLVAERPPVADLRHPGRKNRGTFNICSGAWFRSNPTLPASSSLSFKAEAPRRDSLAFLVTQRVIYGHFHDILEICPQRITPSPVSLPSAKAKASVGSTKRPINRFPIPAVSPGLHQNPRPRRTHSMPWSFHRVSNPSTSA